MAIYAFILAGGSGERLWPLSTVSRPKPLLALPDGKSLLAHTISRLVDSLLPPEQCFVMAPANLREAFCRNMAPLHEAQFLPEPCARNTAAAAAWACGLIRARDPEGVIALLPADHVIQDVPRFRQRLADAAHVAASCPVIAALGIPQTAPNSAFGHLICGAPFAAPGMIETPFRTVRRFIEKPDAALSARCLKTGACLWNAGIYVAQARVLEAAFRVLAPAWLPLIENPRQAETLYPALPVCAVDHAIMEQADNLIAAPADFGWRDVGLLTQFAACFPHDSQGNGGNVPLVALRSEHCEVLGDAAPERTTLLVGVKDLVVVQTATMTMICSREEAGRLRDWRGELPNAL